MPEYIPVITFVALFFGAMILRLATSSGFANKLTGWMVVIAAFGGFVFYGYAYTISNGITFLAVIRALLSVCDMFTGSVDEGAIAGTIMESNPVALTLFWLIHLMALYATASATISVIGAEALRKLRVWSARWGELHIIYGANPDTVAFARNLADKKKGAIVFVEPTPADGPKNNILKNGFLLRSDSNAVQADIRFAKSIGVRKRRKKITLYAINTDGMQNLAYAKAFMNTLQQLDVSPERTHLVMLGNPDYISAKLLAQENNYGYGSVAAFREADLVSRVLIKTYPPCDTIQFDQTGRATEDFHALIIGFGSVGQSVLRQLIMNGQFVGSHFRCDVFAPDCYRVGGLLNSQLQNRYDIRLHSDDGRSREIYQFLQENIHSLKYITICTGSERTNRELAIDITQFCQSKNIVLPVYQCSHQGIISTQWDQRIDQRWMVINDYDPRTLITKETSLFNPELMSYEYLDTLAMLINQQYCGSSPKSAIQLWMECDYFTRMSNRAAADFIPAILRMANTDVDRVLKEGWSPDPRLLENLGICEHLRWCAFHHVMGFRAMTREEFQARVAKYKADMEQHGCRITSLRKDLINRTHICLVPWDELDQLSEMLYQEAGVYTDFKAIDIQNIQIIRQALMAGQNLP